MIEHDVPNRGDRVAGSSLVIAAGLTVFAMAHHPTIVHGGGGLIGLVHGLMIVLVVVRRKI